MFIKRLSWHNPRVENSVLRRQTRVPCPSFQVSQNVISIMKCVEFSRPAEGDEVPFECFPKQAYIVSDGCTFTL